MNILLLGSGGREHAIAWKIAQSKKLSNLYIAPGNAGTAKCGKNIDLSISDFEQIKDFVLENKITMLIVGPEVPLVEGIHDYFLQDNSLKRVSVIGPQKEAAKLEGSKNFAKEFMKKFNIPTASYKTFDKNSLNQGLKFLESINPPYVLKADGLAAGKGVIICNKIEEAKFELTQMLKDSKFGKASEKVVIEEFLDGIELSVFVLTDGKSYKILPSAKDYKRIGEGDTGLNTGGMGSISPVPFAEEDFMRKIEERIIKPTIDGLNSENISYKGFIFFGLINVKNEPFVIEYNVRMGDPEAESVIPRIKSDIVDLFEGVANSNISEKTIEIDPRFAAAVMLVSEGYPGSYQKGKVISGLEKKIDCLVFHAGTIFDQSDDQTKTNGGRIIAITSFADSMPKALENSYKNAEIIDFEGKYYRKDLGFDLF
ncbi:MAG: phosphoribosylamine--glycine ligase [Bacteroidales bacterium]|nr:phosphoribosylamine--glycine ligase [Bacteroidales bacterium]